MSETTYGLTQLVAPTSEPVDLESMKKHLRVADWDAEDSLISDYIASAREYVEEVAGIQLMPAQYLMTMQYFPGRRIDEYRPPGWRYGTIRMPKPPLVSVDSLVYVNPDLTLSTLSPALYQVITGTQPGIVCPAPFQVWPVTDPWTADAVRITFTCGGGQVNNRALQAVRMMCAHLYQQRELALPGHQIFRVPYSLESFVQACGYGEYV